MKKIIHFSTIAVNLFTAYYFCFMNKNRSYTKMRNCFRSERRTRHFIVAIVILFISIFGLFFYPRESYSSDSVLFDLPSVEFSRLYQIEDTTAQYAVVATTKKVALTFDADMTFEMKRDLEIGHVASWYNKELIEVLKKHNAKATLFLAGLWAESYAVETKLFARDSLFEIGNHTYDHHAYTQDCYHLPWITDDYKEDDIHLSQEVLTKIVGKTPRLFRFPGLCHDDSDLELLTKHGLITVDGELTADDGFTHDTQKIIDEVLNNVHNGSIVVAHMNGGVIAPKTDEAMDVIIPELRKRGYQFVFASELLHN